MEPELPRGDCQAYVSGSVSEFLTKTIGKNVLRSVGVNGGLGYIRCTVRYDNISFIIKTPFMRTNLFINCFVIS